MLRTKPQLLNAAAWPPDPRYQFLRAGSVPCWSPSAVHWRSSPQQCWRHRLGKVPRYIYICIYIQDGAPKIAKLPYKWLYGRYNYS